MNRSICLRLLLGCLAFSCFAQVNRSGLAGVVTDQSAAGIGGASVRVTSTETGLQREAATDSNGLYRISALPVGKYKVSISRDGFATTNLDDVILTVGLTRTLDVQLNVGSINTVVDVEAQATALDQTTAEVGSVIESKQVREIPINGRNWSFLMALAPGAVNSGEGTQNSIRFFGRSRDDNNWTFDGVDATGIKDPRQEGGLRLVISLDAIAEFKVNSAVYTAESGTASGAQVNVVSKTGTNSFHGSAFEFFRNSALDARRPFDPSTIPPFRLNQFGANIGGPILKNKLFFYANYEGLRQRLGQAAVNGLVPSAAYRQRVKATSPALAPIVDAWPVGQNPTSSPDVDQFVGVFQNRWDEDSGSIRVDYHMNDKTLLFGRFNTTDGTFNDRRSSLLEYRESFVRPTNATIQLQRIFSPSVINETKLGLNRSALARPQVGAFPEAFQVPGFTSTTASTGIREVPSSYSVVNNLTWLKGRHTFKVGGEIRRIHLNSANDVSTTIRYASADAFLRNQMDRFTQSGRLPMFGARRTYWLGYAQDEFRVNPELVLNLGARYEYYSVYTEVNGRGKVLDFARCGGFCPAGTPWYFPDKNNLAPRIGIAWSPKAMNGKTVVRTGYGIFYGTGQNDDVTAAIDSEPESFQLTRSEQPALAYPITPFLNQAKSTGQQPRSLQRDRRDIYSQQWSFSLQQELKAGFVGQAGYVGNRGTRLFNRSRTNLLDPVTRVRPYPQFNDIDEKQFNGNSTFHGLQASLQRSFFRGLLWQTQYMWSKSIDDNAGAGDGSEYMIVSCRRCERAVADFDIRHTVTMNSVYELPFGQGAWWGGWNLSGLFTARTGRPFSPSVDRSTAAVPDGNTTALQRPDLVFGVSPIPDQQTADRWVNPGAFRSPANGTWGNAPRNMLRAPGLWQMDLAVSKRTQLTEGVNVELRGEAFNLFNRAQFGIPATNTSRNDFGIIRTTANDGATGFGTSRMLQLMLRLNF